MTIKEGGILKWYQIVSVFLLVLLLSPLFIIPVQKYGTGNHQTLVSLTFDDGYTSWVTNANPILQRYDLPATGFVNNPDYFGSKEYTPNKEGVDGDTEFSWVDIKELKKTGWEIGWHTASHPNLDNLTRPKILNALTAWKGVFENHNLPKPITFAYPYGSYDENAVEVASHHFIAARTCHGGINTPQWIKEHPTKIKLTKMPPKAAIRLYEGKGVLITFLYHTVGQVAERQTKPGITTEEFKDLCKFLAKKRIRAKIKVVSFKEGIREMRTRDTSSTWTLECLRPNFEFQTRYGIPIPSRYFLVYRQFAREYSAINIFRSPLGLGILFGILLGIIGFILTSTILSIRNYLKESSNSKKDRKTK